MSTPDGEYILDSRWSFTTSELVSDGERFWLHAVVQREFGEEPVDGLSTESGSDASEHTHRMLGVDLNVDGYTAVTSTGAFCGNADAVNAYRSDHKAQRGARQQAGTRSAHLRCQKRRGVEWRDYDQYAHDVSNTLTDATLRVRATHLAFEKLTRIRHRISHLPSLWYCTDTVAQDALTASLTPPRGDKLHCESLDDNVEASSIRVTELVLIARAVYQLWRAGYDSGTADALNEATNPT